MKKLILYFVSIFLLSGCLPSQFIEKRKAGDTQVFFLDFRPYVQKGFTFSTGTINQEFTEIGTLNMVFLPVRVEQWTPYGSYFNSTGKEIINEDGKKYFIWTANYENPEITTILEQTYKKVIDIGGNGLINFKITINEDNTTEIIGTVVNI